MIAYVQGLVWFSWRSGMYVSCNYDAEKREGEIPNPRSASSCIYASSLGRTIYYDIRHDSTLRPGHSIPPPAAFILHLISRGNTSFSMTPPRLCQRACKLRPEGGARMPRSRGNGDGHWRPFARGWASWEAHALVSHLLRHPEPSPGFGHVWTSHKDVGAAADATTRLPALLLRKSWTRGGAQRRGLALNLWLPREDDLQ